MTAPPSPAPPTSARGALARLAHTGAYAFALFVPWSVAGVHISLGVMLAALVLLRLQGQRVWARSALDLPVLLVTGAAILSIPLAALAGSPPASLHGATLWRSFLAPLVVLSAITVELPGEDPGASRRRALRMLLVWAAAAVIPSALAWVQLPTGFDALHAMGLRRVARSAPAPRYPGHFAAVGFFWWYTVFAQNLTPPLLLAGAVALYGGLERRRQVLLAAACAIVGLAVALSFSRAAWVALAAGAVGLALLGGRAFARAAVPLTIAAFVAIGVAQPGLRNRLVHAIGAGENDDRKQIWGICAEIRREYPWTGLGWGNLHARGGAYDRIAPPDAGIRAGCHNVLYTALVDGGPLLLAATLAYVLLLFRAFARAAGGGDLLGRAAARGALAGTAALLLNGAWHDVFYSSEPMYGLALALAIAAALSLPRAGQGAGVAQGR